MIAVCGTSSSDRATVVDVDCVRLVTLHGSDCSVPCREKQQHKTVLIMARSLFAAVLTTLLAYHAVATSSDQAYSRRSLASRSLTVAIQPNAPPKTVPFDKSLQKASPDIATNDYRVAKATPGCVVPEQVTCVLMARQQMQHPAKQVL